MTDLSPCRCSLAFRLTMFLPSLLLRSSSLLLPPSPSFLLPPPSSILLLALLPLLLLQLTLTPWPGDAAQRRADGAHHRRRPHDRLRPGRAAQGACGGRAEDSRRAEAAGGISKRLDSPGKGSRGSPQRGEGLQGGKAVCLANWRARFAAEGQEEDPKEAAGQEGGGQEAADQEGAGQEGVGEDGVQTGGSEEEASQAGAGKDEKRSEERAHRRRGNASCSKTADIGRTEL